jgi:hypothetical protein
MLSSVSGGRYDWGNLLRVCDMKVQISETTKFRNVPILSISHTTISPAWKRKREQEEEWERVTNWTCSVILKETLLCIITYFANCCCIVESIKKEESEILWDKEEAFVQTQPQSVSLWRWGLQVQQWSIERDKQLIHSI